MSLADHLDQLEDGLEGDGDNVDLATRPSVNQVNLMINDLVAACNSLGKLDVNDGTYMKDRDCKSCLKEIIRILNNDTKQHDVRIMLGKHDIVKNDLIPLMNQYCDYNEGDTDLFNLIMRLSTNMTASALLLFEHQEVPADGDSRKIYNQLMAGLSSYKKAFANDTKIWRTLNTHLRHTEEEIPFERLLILIRNVLHIPVDASEDQGVKSGFDNHELCLHRMDQSGIFHTLIEVASQSQRGTEFCFHIIEIVYLMLRDQNPLTVAQARPQATKRKLEETDADSQRLAELAAREKRERLVQQRRSIYNPRFKHSAFVVQNFNSIGERPVITNRIVASREELSFDSHKTELRKSKNRKPLSSEANSAVISDRNTRASRITYSLQVFSKMFVERVYANYMQQIKHNLIQKKAADNDESYYLWSIQYFTCFARHMGLSMDHISETISISGLHFIQILITNYQDALKLEKRRGHAARISKRLHMAVRAYREILDLIRSVKEGSPLEQATASIKRTILNELEYNSLLLTLFQQYDSSKHCQEYLKDLIEANDVFLDLQGERVNEFVNRYCAPDIISAYSSALHNLRANGTSYNLKILRFFERIAYGCKTETILMQASLLRCLLEAHDYLDEPRFTALIKHIMARFGDMLHKRRWMIQELLFWKTHNDVVEIEMAVDPPAPGASVDAEADPDADAAALAASPSGGANEDDEERLQAASPDGGAQPPGDSLDDLLAELGSDDDVDGDDDDGDDDGAAGAEPARAPAASPQANGDRHDEDSPRLPSPSPLPSPGEDSSHSNRLKSSQPEPEEGPASLRRLLDSSPSRSPSPRPPDSAKRGPLRILDSSPSPSASRSPSPLPSPDDEAPSERPRWARVLESSPSRSPSPLPSPVPSPASENAAAAEDDE